MESMWRGDGEHCCGDQMGSGPCGVQIHALGLLSRRITLQPDRERHWFCLFPLRLSLCLPSPRALLLSSECSSGTWMKRSSFSIPCSRGLTPTDMDGWVTDCDSSLVLYLQQAKIQNLKRAREDWFHLESMVRRSSIAQCTDNYFFF